MSKKGYDEFQIALLPGIGSGRGRLLLERFKSFGALLKASERSLLEVRGISHRTAADVLETLRSPDKLRAMHDQYLMNMEICAKEGIRFLPWGHPGYPEVLKSIYDPPLYVFLDGSYETGDDTNETGDDTTEADDDTTEAGDDTTEAGDDTTETGDDTTETGDDTTETGDVNAVAIVGTRNPTTYGIQATERIARGLAENHVTIVSGLAIGIDTQAHKTALESGGRTIAVLGSGLKNIYPHRNRKLAGLIAENGCFLSELPLTAKPDAMNFPRRNRIISALSKAVVLVESEEKGGGMITAEIALDQNREIFAVPGSIFNSKSSGPLLLLKKNMAHLIRDADDLFYELPTLKPEEDVPRCSQAYQLTLEEQRLFEALSFEPRHIDDVLRSTDFSPSDLLVLLLDLEFKGVVRQLPGKHFVLSG